MGCLTLNTKNEKENECIIKGGTNYIVPGKIIEKLSETIVRIENENIISTGFFMKINVQEINHNFLFTCAHSITKENINSKKTISIFYGKAEQETEKKIELDNNKRFIKCFIDDDIDATIIEILPEDKIPENKYLYPDLNYINGFDNYINEKIIFTAGYPDMGIYKGEKHYSGGEIFGIKFDNDDNNNNKNYHFYHKCSTKKGSSGSPLVNASLQVIGIHYGGNKKKSLNFGVFVGAIIKILNNDYKQNKINFKAKSNEKEGKIIKDVKFKEEKYENDNNKETINNYKNDDETKELFIDKDKINKKENIQKNEDNELLVKALSKGKKNNIQSQNQSSDSDMALIGQMFNNPSFLNITKTLSKDPKVFEKINKMPDIQKLKETNPIFKEALKDPDLLDDITNLQTIKTFNKITSIINNNKKNKEKENDNIDDPKILESKVNQLKNMGFKDDKLIREALMVCKGNIEDAKEYLSSAC